MVVPDSLKDSLSNVVVDSNLDDGSDSNDEVLEKERLDMVMSLPETASNDTLFELKTITVCSEDDSVIDDVAASETENCDCVEKVILEIDVALACDVLIGATSTELSDSVDVVEVLRCYSPTPAPPFGKIVVDVDRVSGAMSFGDD